MMDESSYQYLFTVFTPTYNRAYTLSRVYDSLKAQTYRNFEWLIVDDGSTDNTCTLVKHWQEAEFPIRYIWQENQGKHVAFNRAVREAKGKLFLTFDSDDACVPEALERFKYHWDSIPAEQRKQFSAVTVLCKNQQGELVGNSFPFDVFVSNSIDIHAKHQVFGEKWGFQRTDVLKEFPFPEIAGERFITEGIVWNRISLKYKTLFVNEQLRIYYESRDDSLSTSSVKMRASNPVGAKLYYQEYIKLPISTKCKLKSMINYVRFALHAHTSFEKLFLESERSSLLIILFPIGYILYKRDIYTIKRQTSI